MAHTQTSSEGFLRRRPVVSLLILTAVVSAILFLLPGLDLAAARLFYRPGEGFPLADSEALKDLRAAGQNFLRLAGLFVLVSLVVPLVFGRVRLLLPPRAALFLFTSLVVGQGLIVNLILKDSWGRARPRDVVEFGGQHDFSPAWAVASGCDVNCSFVSGEASSAMWFMAFVMIAPLAWRLPAALAVLAFAVVMSVNRMAFGAHFLSDVLIGWLLTLTVVVLCYDLFFKRGLTDASVDAWFTHIRDFLQAPLRLLR